MCKPQAMLYSIATNQFIGKCPIHKEHFRKGTDGVIVCPIGGAKCIQKSRRKGYVVPHPDLLRTPGNRYQPTLKRRTGKK